MIITTHTARGKLEYYDGGKAILVVSQGLADFYRSLIPKHIYSQGLRNHAHITIVRGGIEKPDFSFWGLDEGKYLTYTYTNEVRMGQVYATLPAWSDDIGRLRAKLGLPKYRVGFTKYHITIARLKD